MEADAIRQKAAENSRLLQENPREYVRRLRAAANQLVGQLRDGLLDKADEIERQHVF